MLGLEIIKMVKQSEKKKLLSFEEARELAVSAAISAIFAELSKEAVPNEDINKIATSIETAVLEAKKEDEKILQEVKSGLSTGLRGVEKSMQAVGRAIQETYTEVAKIDTSAPNMFVIGIPIIIFLVAANILVSLVR